VAKITNRGGLISVTMLIPSRTRAETVVEAWVQRYNGPWNASDRAKAVAVKSAKFTMFTRGLTG